MCYFRWFSKEHSLQNPLIVQSDRSLLLEVAHPQYQDCRNSIARFAEMEKSPEHIHTFRISPLSLWNASASGSTPRQVIASMRKWSRYPVPQSIEHEVSDLMGRYGRLQLVREEKELFLVSEDHGFLESIRENSQIKPYMAPELYDGKIRVPEAMRGPVKQALIKLGYPVEDMAGYTPGTPLDIRLKTGSGFRLRDYQTQAADTFYASGTSRGGNGVVVLPCGAGKTIVGMAAMDLVNTRTLILVTNVTAAWQWQRELLEKTSLTEEEVGEYTGESKKIKPVTVATYQILTHRKRKSDPYVHFGIFDQGGWGLIIYDEVHLLPAPVFRITADLQARRRLGLTATLIREDGRENDVFSLIGPKRYDVPWKDLEAQGWIAAAHCREIRVPLPSELRNDYAAAPLRDKVRIAMENPRKGAAVSRVMARHPNDRVLIIGQYLEQLEKLAGELNVSLVTGATRNKERNRLYQEFREGSIKCLMVSKVGNFAIDLPEANVAIQISGTFGSRQEEAQRLGRILRPKSDGGVAQFYSLVTPETRDQDFAMNRQLFLTEQGYSYQILSLDELDG